MKLNILIIVSFLFSLLSFSIPKEFLEISSSSKEHYYTKIEENKKGDKCSYFEKCSVYEYILNEQNKILERYLDNIIFEIEFIENSNILDKISSLNKVFENSEIRYFKFNSIEELEDTNINFYLEKIRLEVYKIYEDIFNEYFNNLADKKFWQNNAREYKKWHLLKKEIDKYNFVSYNEEDFEKYSNELDPYTSYKEELEKEDIRRLKIYLLKSIDDRYSSTVHMYEDVEQILNELYSYKLRGDYFQDINNLWDIYNKIYGVLSILDKENFRLDKSKPYYSYDVDDRKKIIKNIQKLMEYYLKRDVISEKSYNKLNTKIEDFHSNSENYDTFYDVYNTFNEIYKNYNNLKIDGVSIENTDKGYDFKFNRELSISHIKNNELYKFKDENYFFNDLSNYYSNLISFRESDKKLEEKRLKTVSIIKKLVLEMDKLSEKIEYKDEDYFKEDYRENETYQDFLKRVFKKNNLEYLKRKENFNSIKNKIIQAYNIYEDDSMLNIKRFDNSYGSNIQVPYDYLNKGDVIFNTSLAYGRGVDFHNKDNKILFDVGIGYKLNNNRLEILPYFIYNLSKGFKNLKYDDVRLDYYVYNKLLIHKLQAGLLLKYKFIESNISLNYIISKDANWVNSFDRKLFKNKFESLETLLPPKIYSEYSKIGANLGIKYIVSKEVENMKLEPSFILSNEINYYIPDIKYKQYIDKLISYSLKFLPSFKITYRNNSIISPYLDISMGYNLKSYHILYKFFPVMNEIEFLHFFNYDFKFGANISLSNNVLLNTNLQIYGNANKKIQEEIVPNNVNTKLNLAIAYKF